MTTTSTHTKAGRVAMGGPRGMELGFGNVLPLALFPPPFFVVPTSPFFFFFPSIFVCFFGWECPRAMLHVDDLLAKKQPLFTGLHCPTRQFATSEGAKRGTPHITHSSNNVYLPYFLPPSPPPGNSAYVA